MEEFRPAKSGSSYEDGRERRERKGGIERELSSLILGVVGVREKEATDGENLQTRILAGRSGGHRELALIFYFYFRFLPSTRLFSPVILSLRGSLFSNPSIFSFRSQRNKENMAWELKKQNEGDAASSWKRDPASLSLDFWQM